MKTHLILLDQAAQLSRSTLFVGDKLGTVVAVLLLIFGGLVTWLIVQERRIRRLERSSKHD
jgi:hypothetical protein